MNDVRGRQDVWLSKYFTYRECIRSATASIMSIDNRPGAADRQRLEVICQQVADPFRERFGATAVRSGFRSLPLNQQFEGASPMSAHLTGNGLDLDPIDSAVELEDCMRWLWEHREELAYDQAILEHYRPGHPGGWIHVGTSRPFDLRPARGQLLIIDWQGVRPWAAE